VDVGLLRGALAELLPVDGERTAGIAG